MDLEIVPASEAEYPIVSNLARFYFYYFYDVAAHAGAGVTYFKSGRRNSPAGRYQAYGRQREIARG